jgi:hypothetical protein
MSGEVFQVDQGDELKISPITLLDSLGAAITAYDGSQSLTVTVWPGGGRAAAFTFTNGNATWLTVSPTANTVQIIITPAQTASLYPVNYDLKLEINDSGNLVKAYSCTLEVGARPEDPTQPPAYPSDPSIRIVLEAELIDRTGGLLTLVGKSTEPTGSNPNLTGAIGFGLQHLNVTPLTPGVVTDADIARLDPSLWYTLCDLCEYRILDSCLMNFVVPNQKISLGSQDWGSMMNRFQTRLSELQMLYGGLLSVRKNPTVSGSIRSRYPVGGDSFRPLGLRGFVAWDSDL